MAEERQTYVVLVHVVLGTSAVGNVGLLRVSFHESTLIMMARTSASITESQSQKYTYRITSFTHLRTQKIPEPPKELADCAHHLNWDEIKGSSRCKRIGTDDLRVVQRNEGCGHDVRSTWDVDKSRSGCRRVAANSAPTAGRYRGIDCIGIVSLTVA